VGARTDAARAEVVAARRDLAAEYDQLGKAARDAVDVPARIRRAPAQSAAVAGGAAFVVLGGPRRVLRRVRRAVFGEPTPLPKSMLPEEVEKAVRALGTDGDAVRGALERSFAEYLDKRGSFAKRDVRSAASETVASTIRLAGRAAGVQLVRRMMAGEGAQLAAAIDQVRRIIQRGTTGTPGTTGGAYGEGPAGGREGDTGS
jgi:hypothetical protein